MNECMNEGTHETRVPLNVHHGWQAAMLLLQVRGQNPIPQISAGPSADTQGLVMGNLDLLQGSAWGSGLQHATILHLGLHQGSGADEDPGLSGGIDNGNFRHLRLGPQ